MLWSEYGVPGGFWADAHFVGRLLNGVLCTELDGTLLDFESYQPSARRWRPWAMHGTICRCYATLLLQVDGDTKP